MPAQGQSGAKGNPASRRMSNTVLKARRARSWSRAQDRKAARRAHAQVAHSLNVSRGTTAWQLACEARAVRRLREPEVQRRAAQYR